MKSLLFLAITVFTFAFYSNAIVFDSENIHPNYNDDQGQVADSISKLFEEVYGSYGINLSQTVNQELYLRAANWLGVEYRYGHKSPEGIDCSGFVKKVTSGLFVDTLTGGARHIYHKCMPIDKSMLQEGDLVFFKINKPYISHVGIYLQNNMFIHATTRRGVTISSLFEDYYQKYFYASGRLIK